MIKEIYTRSPDDPNYKINVLDHSDPIESILSKIKMILGTKQGSVFGDAMFGMNLEELIFETKVPGIRVEEDIKKQINQYISEAANYKIDPKVTFGKNSDGYDYCVIDIYIDNQKSIGLIVN